MADMRFAFGNERALAMRAGLVLNRRFPFLGQGARRFRAITVLLVTAALDNNGRFKPPVPLRLL
jgi:hypothetical protein